MNIQKDEIWCMPLSLIIGHLPCTVCQNCTLQYLVYAVLFSNRFSNRERILSRIFFITNQ